MRKTARPVLVGECTKFTYVEWKDPEREWFHFNLDTSPKNLRQHARLGVMEDPATKPEVVAGPSILLVKR